MTNEQETLDAFIARVQLRMTAAQVPARPDHLQSDWHRDASASHYVCSIERVGFGQRDPVTVCYSMGSAHKGKPRLRDVLDSLASDSDALNYQDFEDWADNVGYNQDSRKAETTYRLCVQTGKALKKLLGLDFPALLACERR